MKKASIIIGAFTVAALGIGAAFAQSVKHDMHGSTGMPAHSPSSEAYAKANDAMHKNMSIPLTGDADRDFVQGMIPHHQGAIDMARVELQYGKDPAIRKIAEGIIAAQESEIAQFKAWLAKNPK
jgi:uncharacterized protein (DUF305 family)